MRVYLKRCILILVYLTAFGEDLSHATVAVYAIRSDTGQVLMDQNSNLSLIPASCMKVVTTGAALNLLDAEKRFETHLEYDGTIDLGKTLHGNLYIRGGGDPCLGSGRITSSLPWEKQIETWVKAIQKLEIQKIEGRVIEDASKWEKALAAPSWSWEDIGNYYGAGASALSFHENSYSLVLKPGKQVGDPVSILRIDPPFPTLVLQNEVKTGPEGSGDQACIYGSEFISLQYVRGTIPAAVAEFTIKGAIPDPAALAADSLSRALEKVGITIEKKELPIQTLRISFHKTMSPTIREITHLVNQASINLYAEHLLKEMGFALYKEGSTTAGIRAVQNFWKSQNIDLDGFNMVDGSGLSRKNFITAKQLVQMLLKMKESTAFPLFFESLPKGEGEVRAKSGSMSFIRGYAGYTGEIVFAIMMNHCKDHQSMRKKIQSIVLKLRELDLQNQKFTKPSCVEDMNLSQ